MKLTEIIAEEYAESENRIIGEIKKGEGETDKGRRMILLAYKHFLSERNEEILKGIPQINAQIPGYTQQLNRVNDPYAGRLITCHGMPIDPEDFYQYADNHIQKIIGKYTPEDISHFSFEMNQFQNEVAFPLTGLFISCLINRHANETKEEGNKENKENKNEKMDKKEENEEDKEEAEKDEENKEHKKDKKDKNENKKKQSSEYLLVTEHLETPIDGLCTYNTSNVTIQGNVYSMACNKMSGGIVTIHGNCEHFLGQKITGGTIYIYGGAGNFLGEGMENGEISVYGKKTKDFDGWKREDSKLLGAGIYVGKGMKKGKIIINGYIGEHIGDHMEEGRIYINTTIARSRVKLAIDETFKGGRIYHNNTIIESGARKRLRRFLKG